MRKCIILLAITFIFSCCQQEKEPIAVTGVYISETSLTLIEGNSCTIHAEVQPNNADIKDINWTSSKPGVASVNNGVIVAHYPGFTSIIATSKDGGKTAVCEVIVEAKTVPVESIELSPTEMTLTVGDERAITATIIPTYATNHNVTWKSSDSNVVSVDNGTVCAIAPGNASISATTEDGKKKAWCKIEVKEKIINVESVSLSMDYIELTEEEEFTLIAKVYPENASDQQIIWSSNKESVATVDNGIVKAIREGSATITVTTLDGNKTDTCHVKVNAKFIPVESISLNTTFVELDEGGSTYLSYTIFPEDATIQNVSWESSDELIATVQDGYVTTHKDGHVTITVTTEDGGHKATCELQINARPTLSSLTIDDYSFNAFIGKYYDISASVSPSNAKYNLEWSVSDSKVAYMYCYSGQSATIYTSNYGCSDITVTDKISGLSASISVSTIVENFTWKEESDETLYGYPVITIKVGEERQLKYSCTPSYATNLFSDLSQFNFYATGSQVESQDIISIDANGVVTGLKEGTIGIKGTGRVSGNRDRLYIKVISTYTESEYNDDFTYADVIPAGEKMKFKISDSSDIDIFKFTRPQNGFYFSIKLIYEGGDSYTDTDKHIKYTLYNSNLEPYGNSNITFDSYGGEDSNDTRYIDTSEGYIKFQIDDYWKYYPSTIPTGYFTVEFY